MVSDRDLLGKDCLNLPSVRKIGAVWYGDSDRPLGRGGVVGTEQYGLPNLRLLYFKHINSEVTVD